MSNSLSLVAVLITFLADAPKEQGAEPSALSSEEAAAGWILLFDGESMIGWKVDGEAAAKDGVLVLGGAKETKAESTTLLPWEGTTKYSFSAEIDWEGDSPPKFFLPGFDWLSLLPSSRGKFTPQRIDQYEGKTMVEPPMATIKCDVPAGSKMLLRNVKYQPKAFEPLFNGKDLTGWKEIKNERSKSVFSVTPDGELSIKDGPGDLQTVDQFDDFILQIEIKTNGMHLNSGVFFRSLPGEFWAGYEAQIRNQWEGDDRTKPVDFGTGAIYRRQAARKVVASDNEWFTMTVIAQGNHFATWVNGVQVVDFFDTRPANTNGRNGFKRDKGVISLQGHDPTTDLLFRNIRISRLPRS